MSVAFYIQQIGHCTKITNDSEFDVMISWKPIKPKRKVKDEIVVHKKSFLLLEPGIDIEKIYISFLNG